MAKRNRLFVLVLAAIALLALGFLSIRLIAGDTALPDLLRAGGIPEPVEAVEPACQEAGGPGAEGPAPVTRQLAKQEDLAPARAPSGPEDPLLEVEVYYLENEHEQRAAGARVVVSPGWLDEEPDIAGRTSRCGPDERSPWAAEREFFCDAQGRVILPLGAMAGPVGKQGADFHTRPGRGTNSMHPDPGRSGARSRSIDTGESVGPRRSPSPVRFRRSGSSCIPTSR